MIKAVFIDIDNTLLDFNLNAYYGLESTFIKSGLDFKKEYFDTFLTINTGLWDKIEKKEITRAEHKRVRFKLIFEALGINSDSDRAEELFRSELYDRTFEVEGATDLLKYLCGKYRVFAASNAIEKQQIYRLKKANMYDLFEKVFISEGIGHDKPSKGFFDYCFSVAKGFTPKEAVMIGDSLYADIKGGKEYGLTTVWFNNHGKVNDNPEMVDYEVNSLKDIKSIL